MLVTNDFSIDILPAKRNYYKSRYSKSIRKNTEFFVDWVLNILKKYIPECPDGYKYDAQALYLNSKNLKELSKHVNPMDYLAYSPTTDDSLADDELGIDLNSIILKDKLKI